MSEYRRQIVIGGVAAVIVGIIVIASVAYLPLGNTATTSSTTLGNTTNSTSETVTYPTSTSTSSFVETNQTTNSTLGLQLLLSVNSSTVSSGGALGVSVSILNTLSTINNLSASNSWPIKGMLSGPCDLGNSTDKIFSPEGIAVFRGNYGLNNVSTANPLRIWALVECPASYAFIGGQALLLHNITSYSFLPAKDSGNYSGYYVLPSTASSTCSAFLGTTQCTYYSSPATFARGVFPTQMSFSTTIYANNATGGPSVYNSLLSSLPADYTLVAGDEWGQVVILHFSVTAREPISFVQGSASMCTGSCNYPSPYLSAEVLVNSTSPLRSLQLYINGTYEGTSSYTNNFTTADVIQYKANPTNQTMPILSGKAYEVTLTATFQDNSISSASTVVIASSVPAQSSTDLVCVTTNYQVLGIESMTTQNGTTEYLPVTTTTISTVGKTVTTTTNVTETVSYVTATTSYTPPSSWTVVDCTYVK